MIQSRLDPKVLSSSRLHLPTVLAAEHQPLQRPKDLFSVQDRESIKRDKTQSPALFYRLVHKTRCTSAGLCQVVTWHKSLCICTRASNRTGRCGVEREVVVEKTRHSLSTDCMPVPLCSRQQMLVTRLLDGYHYIPFTREKS